MQMRSHGDGCLVCKTANLILGPFCAKEASAIGTSGPNLIKEIKNSTQIVTTTQNASVTHRTRGACGLTDI